MAREEFAPGCFRDRPASPRERRVMAAFRPTSGDIALFVEDGDDHAAVTLSIEEAQAIHDTLGQALKLAACRAAPLSAVGGQ